MNMKYQLLFPLAGLLLAGCVTRTYTVATPPPPPGPSLTEVQTMAQAHVSDSLIIGQIQNSSTRYQLTADQIISLKNAGVSEAVINTMINSASKPQSQATATTTVVQEPAVYVAPWPLWWGPYWGPYYHGYWR